MSRFTAWLLVVLWFSFTLGYTLAAVCVALDRKDDRMADAFSDLVELHQKYRIVELPVGPVVFPPCRSIEVGEHRADLVVIDGGVLYRRPECGGV